MDYKSAIKAIDFFLNYYENQSPPPQEFCVDFTGTGEPLLNFELLERIAKYVVTRKKKKIYLHFTSNGTLFTPQIIDRLKRLNKQRARLIRFSLTFDGFSPINDLYRKDRSGRGGGNKVLQLIGELKRKRAFSLIDNVNSTYTYDAPLLVYRLKGLYLLGFRRLIMKPYRGRAERFKLTGSRLKKVKKEYHELIEFILSKIIKAGDYGYFFSVFNPGDFLGKFLLRTFTGSEQTRRCPAGDDSFFIDAKSKIFYCPSFSSFPKTALGDINEGFKRANYAEKTGFLAKCQKCRVKKLCGGECFFETFTRKASEPDPLLCELKKFLIKEAAYFWGRLNSEKRTAIGFIEKHLNANHSYYFD